MKITKKQLKKLLDEARNGPVAEAAPPGTTDYSAQAIGERIADAAYNVIDDYVAWHARQGVLSSVMDEILTDAAEIGRIAGEEIENTIAMEMDMASVDQEDHSPLGEARGITNERSGRTSKFAPAPAGEYDEHAGDIDNAEYERGYQDGLDGYPIADDATLDYDAGYEDGKLDADLPEIPYDEARSEDW